MVYISHLDLTFIIIQFFTGLSIVFFKFLLKVFNNDLNYLGILIGSNDGRIAAVAVTAN